MQLVEDGIAALPGWVRDLMKNVAIVIADDLSRERKLEAGFDPDEEVFGLYEGIPRTERGVDYQALPDKITIFKHPIISAYSNKDDIRECVANTIWHEVGHYMGYGEEWLEREEERRGKLK